MRRIEQVVRLIRSKGVGVYFCSQNPDDIPETILGQLGNRVQHALRAFTPRDQKAVKAAAETFASNPNIDVREVIKNMGVGEALVSMLDSKGTPTAVQRAIISPPGCRLGPITDDERQELVDGSELADDYEDLSKLSHEERMSRIFYDPNTQDSHGNPLPQDEIVRIAKEKAEAKAARKAEREALWNPSPDDEPELDSFWQTFWKVLTFR